MKIFRPIVVLSVLMACAGGEFVQATEPNQTFAQSTLLGAGVLSVNDSLTQGEGTFPDTLLAIRSSFGFITQDNDNGGPWEGSLGSGLTGVPINNDSSFWFAVSGNPDFSFTGDHDQFGDYRVFVEIYDDFNFLDETFVFDGSLGGQGDVDEFSLDGFNTNYTYDVFVNNTISAVSDVDFFTFTGLTAGANFSAETMELGFDEIDTFLGWFGNSGNLLETNDDIEPGNLFSLIEGIVPANGKLTFAVTGFGDEVFTGTHGEDAQYTLQLTIDDGATGDFDGDGDIDGRDFLRWQRGGSPSPFSSTDLAAWRANYGPGPLSAVTAVPEPGALSLIGFALGCCGLRRQPLGIPGLFRINEAFVTGRAGRFYVRWPQ